MENNYSDKNAAVVLGKVNDYIDMIKNHELRSVSIDNNCSELSIFDWWKDRLSKNDLKHMRSFLNEAIKLGYTGYVCFKVGVSGCANGMWAHKEETTNGYSPDGDYIYRSFSPDYTYWDIKLGDKYLTEIKNIKYNTLETRKDLEACLNSI